MPTSQERASHWVMGEPVNPRHLGDMRWTPYEEAIERLNVNTFLGRWRQYDESGEIRTDRERIAFCCINADGDVLALGHSIEDGEAIGPRWRAVPEPDEILVPIAASLSAAHAGLPERDPNVPAEAQGLFHKFHVRRVDGSDRPGGKHHGCRYFVLDIDHDPHAAAALQAYAARCAETHPHLSADLTREFGVFDGLAVGDRVEKIGGDYTFVGTVQTVFTKASGAIRIAVEDDRGVLHIYSPANVRLVRDAAL